MSPERSNLQFMEAETNGQRDVYMSGIFIQGDVQNQNGRVYPKSEIQKAVQNIQQRITESGPIMGELDHPAELTINSERVSHLITEMNYSNSNGLGKLKILDTPMGEIVKQLLKGGARLGVSSRGSGNVNESGGVSDFDIVTVDIVAQPSAPEAYPKAIYESLFNMKGGKMLYDVAGARACGDKSAEKFLIEDITAFIKELDK